MSKCSKDFQSGLRYHVDDFSVCRLNMSIGSSVTLWNVGMKVTRELSSYMKWMKSDSGKRLGFVSHFSRIWIPSH